MLVLVVIFAVVGAFFNAWAAVIQRYEAGQLEPEQLFRHHFMKRLLKNKKWLAAVGMQILAFLFQAAALHRGSLILVQPIMTIDLVFLLLLLHFHKHVHIGAHELIAIAMICLGLSGALVFASPTAGKVMPGNKKVVLVICVISAIILVGIYLVRRTQSKNWRAMISAIAAGFSFGLVDLFTKIFSQQVSHGVGFIFTDWQIWGLVASGLLATVMTQNAYGSGPIAISQPTMEIVEPIVGVALGIYIFGDSVNLSSGNLALSLIAGLIACSGIVLLSRSKRLQSQAI
jgi:drug/metabolite transporter (DMT)-like permease